jgi:hypothetical protein
LIIKAIESIILTSATSKKNNEGKNKTIHAWLACTVEKNPAINIIYQQDKWQLPIVGLALLDGNGIVAKIRICREICRLFITICQIRRRELSLSLASI